MVYRLKYVQTQKRGIIKHSKLIIYRKNPWMEIYSHFILFSRKMENEMKKKKEEENKENVNYANVVHSFNFHFVARVLYIS